MVINKVIMKQFHHV